VVESLGINISSVLWRRFIAYQ